MKDSTKAGPTYKKGWMRRWVLLLSVIALSFLVIFGISLAFEEKIKQGIIAEINDVVSVPVEVKGTIDLSIFRHFPSASLTFRKVSIDDRLSMGSRKLLKVQEISFLCNLFSLLTDRIQFSSVVIKQGELNLYKNEKGEVNFDIFKQSKDSSESALSVQLRKAHLEDVRFSYIDKTTQTDVTVRMNRVVLAGDFGESHFAMDVKGKLFVENASTKGEVWIAQRSLNVEVLIDINSERQRYSFRKGKITVEENEFNISGFFALVKGGTTVDFEFKNKGKNIQQLFALLPVSYRENFAGADGKGEYDISASVKGMISKRSQPSMTVSANFKNSEIKFSKYNKLLRNINASTRYYVDEAGKDRLDISNFNCTLNNLPFNFRLSLVDLSNPSFDLYSNGVLHLSELMPFIPDSVLQGLEGVVHFNQFTLKGRKSDFDDVRNSTLSGSGEFQFVGAEFSQDGVTYGNINGILLYKGQIIEAKNFTLNFLGTDFSFSGSIENALPFIYNLSAKRMANEVVLGINGKIKTKTFNLTSIIEAYDRKSNPKRQAREKINIRDVFSMKGFLEVDVVNFVYKSMRFENLTTAVQIAPAAIYLHRLQTQTMGGELRCSGLMTFTDANALQLKFDLTAAELDVSRIFSECENFGQTTLTNKNLKGKVSTSVSLNASWKNYQVLDENSLAAIVDFRITDGQLLNFEPIRAASKFIRVEELNNIRFADISNSLRIANGQLEIPEFEIKSTALNLMFSGTHRFDNIVDYHFKVNLHKLLANKFRRNRSDIQYIEDDPYEGVNIFLSMTGNLANPDIKYDKASVKKKIQADFRKEKEVLKNLRNNKPGAIKGTEERKYFDVKDEPQFMDFEEDE